MLAGVPRPALRVDGRLPGRMPTVHLLSVMWDSLGGHRTYGQLLATPVGSLTSDRYVSPAKGSVFKWLLNHYLCTSWPLVTATVSLHILTARISRVVGALKKPRPLSSESCTLLLHHRDDLKSEAQRMWLQAKDHDHYTKGIFKPEE